MVKNQGPNKHKYSNRRREKTNSVDLHRATLMRKIRGIYLLLNFLIFLVRLHSKISYTNYDY